LVGPDADSLDSIVPVEEATGTQIGFLASSRYLRFVATTGAGALLVARDLGDRLDFEGPRILVADAHEALYRLLAHLHPEPVPTAGVHPTAVVAPDAQVDEGVSIGPYAVVGAGARVGERVRIGAHAVVGERCLIGADSILHPQVVLYPATSLGRRVIVHAGARLGVDGFGYVPSEEGLKKVPQVGGCVIEDDVEIGANTCIDRGSIGVTRVGHGTKLDNLVHLAHNVVVGPHSILVAQVGVAGSTRVGSGVQMGGQVGVSGHLDVGDGARLGAQTGVIGDIAAGETVWGTPARPRTEVLRKQAALGKVPNLIARVRALEERLDAQTPEPPSSARNSSPPDSIER